MLETKRTNSSPSSNGIMKQTMIFQTETSSMKIILTGDSMVNGISEKGLGVNQKVKIVNFPGDKMKRF